MNELVRFIKEEDGVTAIEYALIATLISVLIVVGVTMAGIAMNKFFMQIGQAINNVTP